MFDYKKFYEEQVEYYKKQITFYSEEIAYVNRNLKSVSQADKEIVKRVMNNPENYDNYAKQLFTKDFKSVEYLNLINERNRYYRKRKDAQQSVMKYLKKLMEK